MDLAVGRIPVSTPEEAQSFVDKIIDYEIDRRNMKDWKNRILLIADDQDNNGYVLGAERAEFTTMKRDSTYNFEKIYLDAFQQISTSGGPRYPDAKRAILDALFKGSFIVNYQGHGGPTGLTQERVFTNNEIVNLNNKYKLPLFITATCSLDHMMTHLLFQQLNYSYSIKTVVPFQC